MKLTTSGEITLSNFIRQTPGVHIKEYYDYCARLISDCLSESDKNADVVLGPKGMKGFTHLDIQPEHTLVSDGGRSVTSKINGTIKSLKGDDNYLVRVDRFDHFKELDGVIEYSIPNLVNMRSCRDKDLVQYSEKCKYISPLIYDYDRFNHTDRKGVFTLFSLGSSPRRDLFHKTFGIENIEGVFCPDKLADIYYNKKIMVNIHQTDHHHTFEELRVLPALSQGVVVVAEESPLKEYIPYSESIVWSRLENMMDTIHDVEDNYQEYRDKLFTDKLTATLIELRKNNFENIRELIWKISYCLFMIMIS